MATRSTYSDILPVRLLQAQTISSSALNTGDVDTQGFDSVQIVVDFGDIAEMGASPEGAAQIAVLLEHANDDGTGSAGTYAAVATGDVDSDGAHTVASGVVTTPTSDLVPVRFSYIGSGRFVRVTLTPTSLATGGPVGIWALKGHAHRTPVS